MKLIETHWYRLKIKPNKKIILVDIFIHCTAGESVEAFKTKQTEIEAFMDKMMDVEWTYIRLCTSLLNSVKDCVKVEVETSDKYKCYAEAD